MNSVNKPRILIIGTTDTKGGAATVGWDIGNALRKRGYDVKYLVGYKFSPSRHVQELKKPWLTNLLEEYIHYDLTGFCRHLISFLLANDLERGASTEILEHPWYKQANVILCQNLHGSFFKLQTLTQFSPEKKIIWTLHDMWAMIGNSVYANDKRAWIRGDKVQVGITEYPPMLWNNAKRIWSIKKAIYKKTPSLAVVVPSKWLGEKVKQSILKDKQMTLIYNGVDTSTYIPQNKSRLMKKYQLPKGMRIITFIARGGPRDPRKGWEYVASAARAFASDPSVLFMCIGGARQEHIGNILYVPNIHNKKKLAEYYGMSDALLFTSISDNCPMVILEAMACGTPIVASKVGGVPELVKHKKNGYIAKYKDQKDLERGIAWVLGLPTPQRDAIARNNRSVVVAKYSIKNMVDAYENLL